MKFNDFYKNRPKKVYTKLDTDTVLVSQSEVKVSGLKYQLERFGMNTLQARMEEMRGKFGYADCTKNNDFRTIQNLYRESVDYFQNLPSEIRRKYNDSAEEFYTYIENNPQDAYKTGFISKEKFEELTSNVPIVPPDVVKPENAITGVVDNTGTGEVS